MTTFAIGDTDFLLDGRPHRILSGAIHYFRVHPDQWADRIRKARLMGLNTIETYVAWNAHEPARGQWDATGANDLGRFLDLIAAEGMHAIVRPGPYICAEWHNGGLPVWLTAMDGVSLRRSEPIYLAELELYLRRVYEIVAPRQIDRRGPVVLVQIENEYGAYGDDEDYLRELVRITRDAGITVPLTTVDQPQPQMLRDGSLPELHRTGSFGSQTTERLATLREHQATGPLMCSEFWDGWFDWWGGMHHTTSAQDAAAELGALLAAGASVNIYMFHGGTNFGLTNGANDKGRYLPLVTSYDYDAPLDEAGHPTEKYYALRDVIATYASVPDELPVPAAPAPTPEAVFTASAPLLGRLPDLDAGGPDEPPTFDALGIPSGLVLYSATLGEAGGFEVDEVRDQAWVLVDGVRVGSLSRTRHERALVVPAGDRIDVLVEEQGRVNYGHRLGEPKGLIGAPRLNGRPLTGWTATPIDLEAAAAASLLSLPGDGAPLAGPVVARGSFTLDAAADLFIDTDGWGKGFAFVNGFLLGRYWSNGPQRTLFVPGPVTRVGQNEVTVIELEQLLTDRARFAPGLLLGPVEE
ncbi:beta-galactosidase [Microbacterium horticulturae]|uniref:Beta-galactosidase n=1 Tax=Microbacterium horticulturae TaxID=3028316 RepID=A0ABY8BZ17_9MICO|nr:beta-galactosidase family protein [Microbacterium sp. KACC 23027]WEG09445.1 beta-galactosidase [Microbacterium sp. KACC 23027]